MVIATGHDVQQVGVSAAAVLLRRRAAVYVPAPVRIDANAQSQPGVDLLEADLLDRGWLLSPGLRDALMRLDVADLVGVGARLLADCDALLGADRPHVPLFRDFPASVPDDTMAFFVERVLSLWFQGVDQPCVLCGEAGTVAAVNPCGHLVCRACFDGANFSACPICHRRIALDDPFLRPARPRPERDGRADPQRLRVLHLGADSDADARSEVAGLLARPTALSPGDVEDLTVLLGTLSRTDLAWLPETVPGRATKALLLHWLLADALTDDALDRAANLVDTATDVLRFLVVRSGGDASLIDRPRFVPVSRPLRRALLALLDRIGTAKLVDDMRRHHRAWIAAGERLHPGEYVRRFPAVALAFGALRRTDLSAHPDGVELIAHAERHPGVAVRDGRVRVTVWGGAVEDALAAGDVAAAVHLLGSRPGELLRRLDHLLRLAHRADGVDVLCAAVSTAVPRVSPAVLLSALGQVRTRAVPHRTRVFLPAGRAPVAYVAEDRRDALPADVVARVVALLEAEVLRRIEALPRVDRAVIDAGLDDLVAPFAERTAARALVTLTRGSVLPVPAGRDLRLFLHWLQNPGGPIVDLDLSVALYDDAWTHVATCDYTSLSVTGAVHSGDLTSAPGPLGSSEFVDLDIDALAGAGARYAVVAVLAYNNVPFTELAEAFAGFMLRDSQPGAGEVFDARAVEQRFDLAGPGKLTVPFVVDLAEHTMRWLDVTAKVKGTHHAVHRHHDRLGLLASSLIESIQSGARVTLGELARWHAAGRAAEVLIRDGERFSRYRREPGESSAAFAARLAIPDGEVALDDAADAALQLLVRGDLPTPQGAEVYALYPGGLDASNVKLLAAADLAAALDVSAA